MLFLSQFKRYDMSEGIIYSTYHAVIYSNKLYQGNACNHILTMKITYLQKNHIINIQHSQNKFIHQHDGEAAGKQYQRTTDNQGTANIA